MTLRELARDWKDEIMNGVAWVSIWKTGRAWNAHTFWMSIDGNEFEDADDVEFAQNIVSQDENAILINEYYCAHMGNGTLADIMAGIRFHYENGYNKLKNDMAYINATKGAEQATEEEEQIEELEGNEIVEQTEWPNYYLKGLEEMSTERLVELFCLTTNWNDEHVPTVRGWLMDEVESRNPEGFDKWLDGDAEDANLGKYVL